MSILQILILHMSTPHISILHISTLHISIFLFFSSSIAPLVSDHQTLTRDNTSLTQRQNRDISEPHLRTESSEPVVNFDIINERTKESPRVHVPITLCLVILTSYICGGGVLFSLWEQWNFLDGKNSHFLPPIPTQSV